MNLVERIEEIEMMLSELKLAELKEQALEVEEQEFPQDGDEYWYIQEEGYIHHSSWGSDVVDINRGEIGNVYRSIDEAVFAVEKLKVEAEFRKFSTKYQPYAEIYNIVFHNNSKKVITVTANQTFQDITFYFESEEKANEAIEAIGEERIKKYIFGVDYERD